MRIGDKVKIINDGCLYTSYDKKFRELKFNNKLVNFLDNQHFGNEVYTIFAEGFADKFKTVPIYGIQSSRGSQVLIGISGIALIEKKKKADPTFGLTEPIFLKAGDKKVMINGAPVPVDCRVISEANYQLLMKLNANRLKDIKK